MTPETPSKPNYITPQGFKKLREEYQQMLNQERPALLKVIQWAAGNGDRSENADYIYGKRRLREIDRRLRFLGKRLESAQVVEPAGRQKGKIFFGASIQLEDETGHMLSVQIVGEDEIDTKLGKISWVSPLGKVLLGRKIDDEVRVRTPGGEKTYVILEIDY